MAKVKILPVQGISVATFKIGQEDFISHTDIARNKNAEEPKDVLKIGCVPKQPFNFWVFGNN